jgi:hypothetical protein
MGKWLLVLGLIVLIAVLLILMVRPVDMRKDVVNLLKAEFRFCELLKDERRERILGGFGSAAMEGLSMRSSGMAA